MAHSVLREPSDNQLASQLQAPQAFSDNPNNSNNSNLQLGTRLVVSVFHNVHILRQALTLLSKGSNTAAKPMFGQPAQSTTQPTTGFGIFGNQQPQQPQQQQPQQQQTGNLFGNTGGSIFGQPQPQQQQPQQPQQTGCRLYFCGPTSSLMTIITNSI